MFYDINGFLFTDFILINEISRFIGKVVFDQLITHIDIHNLLRILNLYHRSALNTRTNHRHCSVNRRVIALVYVI
jgi:hypothetical protein